MNPPPLNIQHNAAASCFETTLAGHRAECAYRRQGDVLSLIHISSIGIAVTRDMHFVLTNPHFDQIHGLSLIHI